MDLIVTVSAPETNAAKRAAPNIPIVFAVHGDPVGTGDIVSLAHPGGNITGLAQVHPELTGKQLQVLKEVVPRASQVAVVWNAANPAKARDWHQLKTAAETLSVILQSREVRSPSDFESAFAEMRKHRPDALIVLGDPLTYHFRASITDFASKERLTAMYPHRGFAEVAGLIAYGADVIDLARRAAGYVDKILKGARPADLPVEEPTKFELVTNLKTAKALGLAIPPSLLARADQVIE